MASRTVLPTGREHKRRDRRLLHLAVIVAAGLVGGVVLHPLWPQGTPGHQELSLFFGYVSLGALALTLLVGPFNVVRGRPNPRSTDLRRDLGLSTAAAAGLHVVFAVQSHFIGSGLSFAARMARYFSASGQSSSGMIWSNFVVANWIGALAVVVVAALAATSSDWAVQKLGRRWKQLQRWNYVLAILTVLHTVGYWHIESRRMVLRVAAIGMVLVVVVLQGLGVARTRSRPAPVSG